MQDELFDELPGGVPFPSRAPPPETAADMQALARQYSTLALDALVHVAARGRSDAARTAAARELLDRGFGRSPQVVTGEGGGPVRVILDSRDVEI